MLEGAEDMPLMLSLSVLKVEVLGRARRLTVFLRGLPVARFDWDVCKLRGEVEHYHCWDDTHYSLPACGKIRLMHMQSEPIKHGRRAGGI